MAEVIVLLIICCRVQFVIACAECSCLSLTNLLVNVGHRLLFACY